MSREVLGAVMALALGGPGVSALPRKVLRALEPEQLKRVCGLPGCGKSSLRDYCSAECCKEHRRRQKVT